MASRKNGLVVNITPKRGLHVYFQKKASAFNTCIGDQMRGKTFSTRTQAKSAFTAAAKSCS